MSQSMNGLSLYSTAGGISETDNISCNNIACNGILTDNLTSIQTNGGIANYSGNVSANRFSAPNIHADVRVDADLFECRQLNSYNLISGLQITGTRMNCNEKFVSDSIECDNIKNVKENCGVSQSASCINNVLLGKDNGLLINNNSSYNVGIGSNVFNILDSNANNNIAIGYNSGFNISQGDNNICIGNSSGVLINTNNDIYNNSTAIGNDSRISGSNQIVLGTQNEKTIIRGDLLCEQDMSCNIVNCSSVDCTNINCDSFLINNIELTSATINSLTGLTDNVQNRFNNLSTNSGLAITTGLNNVYLGNFALPTCSSGSYNVAISENSLLGINGNSNIGIGKNSGFSLNENAYDCICLGVNSGQGVDATNLLFNSCAIGAQSKFTKSNEISIGSALHTTTFSGKIEGPDIISKSKMKYGKHQASSNNLTTVTFSTPFPVGSLPFVQLTAIYTGNVTASGFLYVYDYSHIYLTYGYLVNGGHQETSIAVNWMAMIP